MRSRNLSNCCVLAGIVVLSLSCSKAGPARFNAEPWPQLLSEWRLIEREGNALHVSPASMAYDINSPLFSDYAQKLRTIYVPEGSATYDAENVFALPVGTVITKTFFYPRNADGSYSRHSDWNGRFDSLDLSKHELIETRMLVHTAAGWEPLVYVWEGNDARLTITGKLITMQIDADTAHYLVPSRNECAGCHATNHTTKAIQPIGLKAHHLNRTYGDRENGQNQLRELEARGWLTGLPEATEWPKAWRLNASEASLEARARSYLDSNCGHCHNPRGAADTSGLFLNLGDHSMRELGVCKPPVAAGRGSGNRKFSIIPGQPDASILVYRMQTNDPGGRMPEVGRSLTHDEGVAVVAEWVQSLDGSCTPE